MPIGAKIYFANKPSNSNKKMLNFLFTNLEILNRSIVFDFIIANPKDRETYKNMGMNGFPSLIINKNVIIGFEDIRSFLLEAIEKATKPYSSENNMDNYLHNEVFTGVEVTGKGLKPKQDSEDDEEEDGKKFGEKLIQEANRVFMERKQNNKYFADDNGRLAKTIARQNNASNGSIDDNMAIMRNNNIATKLPSQKSSNPEDALLDNLFANMEQSKIPIR